MNETYFEVYFDEGDPYCSLSDYDGGRWVVRLHVANWTHVEFAEGVDKEDAIQDAKRKLQVLIQEIENV